MEVIATYNKDLVSVKADTIANSLENTCASGTDFYLNYLVTLQ